jgi:hypothetical protein
MKIQVANREEARRNERIMITLLPIIVAAVTLVQHIIRISSL